MEATYGVPAVPRKPDQPEVVYAEHLGSPIFTLTSLMKFYATNRYKQLYWSHQIFLLGPEHTHTFLYYMSPAFFKIVPYHDVPLNSDRPSQCNQINYFWQAAFSVQTGSIIPACLPGVIYIT